MERYSAAWFERVLDSLDHFVLVKGEGSRLQWANRSFVEFYGLSRQQMVDVVDSAHSDPDDTVQYVRDDHQVFTTGETLDVVEPATRHDGEVFHYKTRKVALRDDDGDIVGTVGVSHPAVDEDWIAHSAQRRTERKQALVILRELVSSMPTPVMVVDAQYRVLACSDELVVLLGERPEPGADFAASIGHVLPIESLLSEATSADHAVRRDDVAVPSLGLRVNVGVQSWPLPYGERGGALITITDVTDAMNAQNALDERNAALRASQEDQNALMNAAQVGVVAVDDAGQFQILNQAARRMVSDPGSVVTPEDWSGHFQLYRPDGTPFPNEELPLSYAMQGEARHNELMEIRNPPHGGPLWLNVSATPMSDSSRYAAVAVFHDVTALIKTQKELEEFAFVASHDLREPLRMVTGFVELLGLELAGSESPEVKQYLHFAMQGAHRMQALIEDLLEVARAQAHDLRLRPESLQDLMGQVVMDHGPLIAECQATVTFDDLPTVHADASQLARVLANLLTNALKFRDASRPSRVTVSAEEIVSGWRIRVSDNGIGIAEPYRARVFKMFQRLHGRSDYEGNGIGLALCKRIVERHQGRMGIEANEPFGTTVWFELPGLA